MHLIAWWVTIPALLVVLCALILLARELRGWGRPRPARWNLSLEPPINAAHRGGDALFPENTLAAFRAAEKLGARLMEMDVHTSSDGVPVVIHDPSVDRTTDGAGPVQSQTLVELQRLDAGFHFRAPDGGCWRGRGARIPTLEEVLRALPDCFFSIDIKQEHPHCEAAVVDVLHRTQSTDRVVLGSESHRIYLAAHALAPEIPSFFTFRSVFGFYLALWLGLARWYRPPHSALMIPRSWRGIPLVTPRSLRAARRLGLPLLVWTIDDAEQMRELLGMGVDGIVTGRPDLLAQLIGEDAAQLGR